MTTRQSNDYEANAHRVRAILATCHDDVRTMIDCDMETLPAPLQAWVHATFLGWMQQIEGDIPQWEKPWEECMSFCIDAVCWVITAAVKAGMLNENLIGAHHED